MRCVPWILVRALRSLLPMVFFTTACAAGIAATQQHSCPAPGQWMVPETGEATVQPADQVFARLARQQVVLLGESHDNTEHHWWQLHTLAGLHALRPQMVLGLEMFPRRLQPVLDQWVAGQLSDEEFLIRSEWFSVWGYEPQQYMPIFQFARIHRIPMVALNINRSLVSKVGEEGWAAIPVAEREGVTDAAPAQPEYLELLHESYLDHQPGSRGKSAERERPTAADLADPKFRRFVESMLVWDRAMAQGIAERLHGPNPPLVVGLMGSGHLRNGYGIPYQLRGLGVTAVSSALPWELSMTCAELRPGVANLLFVAEERPAAERHDRPRLGISIERGPDGVLIRDVVAGSIAEQAGLQKGDLILMVAGEAVRDSGDVIAAVRRQAPGTWLPLQVKRGETTQDIVARFPPRRP
jgi:uncharacterized iron-regulated protein